MAHTAGKPSHLSATPIVKPSDVADTQTYVVMDPKAIVAYLLNNGWTLIHEDTERFAGISYYHHPVAPRWKTKRLETHYNIPNALDAYLENGGTVVKVVSARFRLDYPRNNHWLVNDLEHHENRWSGAIIADIQELSHAGKTSDSTAPQISYFLPLVGTVTYEDDLVYYDEPILFTVRDERNRRFVGFSAGKTKTYDILWYVLTTDEMYDAIIAGERDVRDIFTEQQYVYQIHRSFRTGRTISSEIVYRNHLNASYLPAVGFRFDSPSISTTSP